MCLCVFLDVRIRSNTKSIRLASPVAPGWPTSAFSTLSTATSCERRVVFCAVFGTRCVNFLPGICSNVATRDAT